MKTHTHSSLPPKQHQRRRIHLPRCRLGKPFLEKPIEFRITCMHLSPSPGSSAPGSFHRSHLGLSRYRSAGTCTSRSHQGYDAPNHNWCKSSMCKPRSPPLPCRTLVHPSGEGAGGSCMGPMSTCHGHLVPIGDVVKTRNEFLV